MDKHYMYALGMTFIYSIIGFVNRNSNQENKHKLTKKVEWMNAVSTATLDAGFAILFFAGISNFRPEWDIILRVATAVFLAVFMAETFVETIKENIKKWKA